jgi:prolyl-tRNA synthetase
VPVRIELGPRDVEQGQAVVVRRDTDTKELVPLAGLADRLPAMLDDVQRALRDQAVALRDTMTTNIMSPDAIDGQGFYRIEWDALGREEGETKLARDGYSVRCLVTADGAVPSPEATDDLVAYVAKAY